MAGLSKDLLFVGIRGTVVALDRATGTERWRTKLAGADFVHLITDGGRLYASTRGRVFSVDAATGTILWENGMKGLGLGLASLLAAGAEIGGGDLLLDEAQRRVRQQQQAAAAAR